MTPVPDPSAAWLPHVGSYRRTLPVSLERLYENALDWEHLPWLHRTSFTSIQCLHADDRGWRARVGTPGGGEIEIELALDREARRWITRTLAGAGHGGEIWTHAFDEGPARTDIVVDFFAPGVSPDKASSLGEAYIALYTRLYDEDVAMMTERQARLEPRGDCAPETVLLGDEATLRARLPVDVEMAAGRFRVGLVEDEVRVWSLVCPHWLGPLDAAEPSDGVVECPWHGYRFDVRSRRCESGQRLRLAVPPRLDVKDGTARLVAAG